jgi:cell wall-associated NlpC family hydrolase
VLVLAVSVTEGPVVHAMASAQPAAAAWVRVSVATVWHLPSSPRSVDAPALGDPVRIEDWLTRLSVTERLGLDKRINTQVLLGQEVLVLARRGRWSEVEAPDQRGSRFPKGIIGWVPNVQLSAVAPPARSREVIVSVARTWLYAVAKGMVARRRFLVSYDTVLPVIGPLPGYLVLGLPGGATGAIADSALSPVHVGAVSGTTVAEQARRFLGLPYLSGGTSAFGYDCSGLVYSLYARYGLYLPRDAADQRHAGTRVPLAKLQPGDLLFFAGPGGKGLVHHVAVYVGGGRVIDSPYTGASVEIVPMTSLPVWDEFAGAIRVTLVSKGS